MSFLIETKRIVGNCRDRVNYVFRYNDIRYLEQEFAPPTNPHCSVLSMNCFGGHIYQDFRIPYESPTAGLFFFAEDFCSLLEDISILKRNILFLPKSKWKRVNDRMPTREHPYPIGCFEGTDIEIQFLHYHSEQDALDKWYRRVERFNFDRFIAIGFQQNECTKETIERFEKIDIPNKVFFTNWDLKLSHAIFMEEFKERESSPDPYKYVNNYYRYLVDYIKRNPLR